jgi:flagellar basal-body rod protein FlgB
MNPSVTNVLSALESYVQLSNRRGQTISGNMANIDTPGYHTHDIRFDQEMHRALMQSASYGPEAARLTPAMQEVSGLLERPDGNNVDLDRESLLLSQMQLQSQLGTQLIKHYFHNLLNAINSGGTSS